ncbi:MAG: hypothetical protein PHF31_02540 [Methylobacter sp.]|nr:hypothetical protein [Methylobacter sp.]
MVIKAADFSSYDIYVSLDEGEGMSGRIVIFAKDKDTADAIQQELGYPLKLETSMA